MRLRFRPIPTYRTPCVTPQSAADGLAGAPETARTTRLQERAWYGTRRRRPQPNASRRPLRGRCARRRWRCPLGALLLAGGLLPVASVQAAPAVVTAVSDRSDPGAAETGAAQPAVKSAAAATTAGEVAASVEAGAATTANQAPAQQRARAAAGAVPAGSQDRPSLTAEQVAGAVEAGAAPAETAAAAALEAAVALAAGTGAPPVVAAGSSYYARTRRAGVFASVDDGRTWQPRTAGLPHRQVYPFPEPPEHALITALGADPTDPRRVAVTTAAAIWLSENGGASWRQLPTAAPVRETAYFTSVALSPHDPDALLLGTSFHGLYETRDRGMTWHHLGAHLGFLTAGALFYEEVAAVSYHPLRPRALALVAGFDGGIFSTPDRAADEGWRYQPPPARGVTDLRYVPARDGWALEAGNGHLRWRLRSDGHWTAPTPLPAPPLPVNPLPPAPRAVAADRHGIYLRADTAARRLPEVLAFLQQHGLNSLVVDFKDDTGQIAYDSRLPLAHRLGAVDGRIDLDRLVAQAHTAGIYVIGRLVVFKDRPLYEWDNFRLAVWDGRQDLPWRHLIPAAADAGAGNAAEAASADAGAEPGAGTADSAPGLQLEYWVDPFAAEVWEYNAAVAAELAARGVDEIQFDYLRFPSDGPVAEAHYRHQQPGMGKIDAIESFLAVARERVADPIPIGADLFGFSSWHRTGNWIGQNIEIFSEYVDVISPMFYPSHFPATFMGEIPYLERAYRVYADGVRRAKRLVQGRSYIRPYVQAFLIGRELEMEADRYGRYLTRQLEGNRTAGAAGFTLWNASNRYYMVTEPLQPYLGTGGESTVTP